MKAPLLRLVLNHGGNDTHLNFPKLHSLAISRSKLGLLKYIIRDNRGEPISSQSGAATLKLFFPEKLNFSKKK